MTTYTFPIVVEPDESGFRAHCPTLKDYGAEVLGSSKEDAISKIDILIHEILQRVHAEGQEIPALQIDPETMARSSVIFTLIERDDWTIEEMIRMGLPISGGTPSVKKDVGPVKKR